jgi:hypothetical protein
VENSVLKEAQYDFRKYKSTDTSQTFIESVQEVLYRGLHVKKDYLLIYQKHKM